MKALVVIALLWPMSALAAVVNLCDEECYLTIDFPDGIKKASQAVPRYGLIACLALDGSDFPCRA